MISREKITSGILLVCMIMLSLVGCTVKGESSILRVFIAGSLIVPFEELEKAYEEAHPDVDVQVEAHGSIQVIRHVTEIHDLIDVVVPADYALIPLLMYPNTIEDSGKPYADWYVEFASNRLAVAYTDQSKYASEVNETNWHEILARPDVRLGLSDPRFDASGYRTLMIVQLAEQVYQQPSIFERIFLGQFTNPIRVEKDGLTSIIHVPEVLEPTESANLVMRGSSIALIALLESGDIDYAFEYESVIKQHGLNYVALPDRLNMGNQDLESSYSSVEVWLDFQRFSTVNPQFVGATIGYGVTIPQNAPQAQLAHDFVAYLLGPEGRAILEKNQHPPLEVPQADGFDRLPDILKTLCVPHP